MSDRCAEADMSVCRTWSKRKLLRAQTCCNNGVHSAALSESCRNYGKKRCKKIRTVLKCCLKTSYSEGQAFYDDVKANTTSDDVKTKVNTSPDAVKTKVNSSPDDVKAKVKISPDNVKTKVNTSPDDVKATSADDVTIEVTTRISYVVCCKEEGGQRTCRVSLEGACEVGETVGQNDPMLQTN